MAYIYVARDKNDDGKSDQTGNLARMNDSRVERVPVLAGLKRYPRDEREPYT